MKTHTAGWVTGLVLLIALPLGIFAGGWGGHGGQKSTNDDYRLEGPFTQGNLTVFLVHGKDKIKGQTFITLQEALVQRKVIVRETREVNSLTIENVSGEEVYVQSGDIVKGGAQDRMLVTDLILPPRSGKIAIDAFCVEGSDTVANHTGIKGLAEPPIIGVAAAVANAVADAIGAEVREIPLTPWRVRDALK